MPKQLYAHFSVDGNFVTWIVTQLVEKDGLRALATQLDGERKSRRDLNMDHA